MSRIPDAEIPKAEPEKIIKQYSPFVQRIASKYLPLLKQTGAIGIDDLIQVGCMALLSAQKTYDPNGGSTFGSWSALYIKRAMRHELGFKADGTAPAQMVYLDEPINAEESDGESRIDNLIDPDGLSPEEIAVEYAKKDEIKKAVNDAIDRLKNHRQRQIIRNVYLDGQEKARVAEALGISIKSLNCNSLNARQKMRNDVQLQQFVLPSFRVGLIGFKQTHTSVVERVLLWKEKQFDFCFGDGAFVNLIVRKDENE